MKLTKHSRRGLFDKRVNALRANERPPADLDDLKLAFPDKLVDLGGADAERLPRVGNGDGKRFHYAVSTSTRTIRAVQPHPTIHTNGGSASEKNGVFWSYLAPPSRGQGPKPSTNRLTLLVSRLLGPFAFETTITAAW